MQSHGAQGHEATPAEVHRAAAARLGTHTQRYTANRRQVVDILLASSSPLTISGILDGQESLAQSSVYRNLVVLEEAGVVHRIVTSNDHARFELAESMTGQHHHHLICDACGSIVDITLPGHVEEQLEQSLAAAADHHGFTGDRHRVDLVGTCDTCVAPNPG